MSELVDILNTSNVAAEAVSVLITVLFIPLGVSFFSRRREARRIRNQKVQLKKQINSIERNREDHWSLIAQTLGDIRSKVSYLERDVIKAQQVDYPQEFRRFIEVVRDYQTELSLGTEFNTQLVSIVGPSEKLDEFERLTIFKNREDAIRSAILQLQGALLELELGKPFYGTTEKIVRTHLAAEALALAAGVAVDPINPADFLST